MQTRELELATPSTQSLDLVLRSGANWTYVLFFACLGMLHLTIATLAFLHSRWEASMSVFLGSIFVAVSIIAHRCRFELMIIPRERRMRLRSGLRRMYY